MILILCVQLKNEFHQTTWATERALEFVDETQDIDKQWMLNINPYDLHPPFIPPKEYADKFRVGNRKGRKTRTSTSNPLSLPPLCSSFHSAAPGPF
jgi:hypothetical protein